MTFFEFSPGQFFEWGNDRAGPAARKVGGGARNTAACLNDREIKMTETTHNSMGKNNSKMAYLSLPLRIENHMSGMSFALKGILGGAEAMGALGEAVEASGHEPGSAVSWAAGKLEMDLIRFQESFQELYEFVHKIAPEVKAEADRIEAGLPYPHPDDVAVTN